VIPNKGTTTYDSTLTLTYDGGDRLTRTDDSLSGAVTLGYDDLDGLISETTPRGSVSYTYDAARRRTGMTVAGQQPVVYGYDNANRLTSLTQGTTAVSLGYDDANRPSSLRLPNNLLVEYAYDRGSQLTGLTFKKDGAVVGDLSYGYDAAGLRVRVGGTFARVAAPQAYASATFNGNNQLTQRGTAAFTYDANGNLTGDGANTYTWDSRNRLSAVAGGSSASFLYDSFGRRVRKTVAGVATDYLYDGFNAVQELSGTTPVANMLTGATDEVFARTDSAGTRSLLTDGLGSTLALADNTGALRTQYTYDAFGATTPGGTASGNASQFTGRENDGTGLYYYRARYYSPGLQRFISEDPIGFAGGDPNLYAYASNSPTNFTDSSGRIIDTLLDIGFIGYDLYKLFTGGRKELGDNLINLGLDAAGAAIPFVTGLGEARRALHAAEEANEFARGTYKGLRDAGLSDSHHIIQDAAVRDLPGYSRNAAPAVQLPGPSTRVGSPHYEATQVQRQAGGGNYAAERRIGYKALRRGGVSKCEARDLINFADDYFNGLGVGPQTPTRIPGNRH
jgi:RHS repeat-associated protein